MRHHKLRGCSNSSDGRTASDSMRSSDSVHGYLAEQPSSNRTTRGDTPWSSSFRLWLPHGAAPLTAAWQVVVHPRSSSPIHGFPQSSSFDDAYVQSSSPFHGSPTKQLLASSLTASSSTRVWSSSSSDLTASSDVCAQQLSYPWVAAERAGWERQHGWSRETE
jgi:hypothetical protein